MNWLICACMLTNFCSAIDWSFFAHSRASAAYYTGHAAQAQQEFEQLLVEQPEQAAYMRGCADSLYAQEKYEQAAHYYQLAHARALDKTEQESLLFNLGCCQAQQKQFKQALETFERVVALNADNKRAQHNIELLKKLLQEEKQQKSQTTDQKKQSANDRKNGENSDQKSNGNEHDQQRDDNQRGDTDKQQPKGKSDSVSGQNDKQVQRNGSQQEPQPKHDNVPPNQASPNTQTQPNQNITPAQKIQLDKQVAAVLKQAQELEQEGQRLYVRAVSGQQQQKRGEHDW